MSEAETHVNTIETEEPFGSVKIADEVVTIIAGLAASEVKGVDSMAGGVTRELIEKLGKKSLSKGIRVSVAEGVVDVDMSLNLKYGFNVPATSAKVQEKVKTAIETMTGLTVSGVNIKIAGVVMDKAD